MESEHGMPSTIMPSEDFSVTSVLTMETDRDLSTRTSGILRRDSSFNRRLELGSLDDDDLRLHPTIQELTMNKLKLDSIGLIGRDSEKEIARSYLQRMLSNSVERGKKFMVLVDGCSGVGKTVFMETIKQEALDLAGDSNSLTFGEGKFDIHSSNVPYSAIASAFGNICKNIYHEQRLAHGNKKKVDESLISSRGQQSTHIGQMLVDEVGENIHLLAKLIPELDLFLPFEIQPLRKSRMSEFDIEAAQSKWQHAFRAMACVLSTYCGPLIIILDDLHWADISSLNVIEFLISDTGNNNKFMIFGSYRSDEENNAQNLTDRIESLETKQKKFNFQIINISLTNLDLDGVNHVVMSLLSITDETETRNLAQVCFKRSLGNPFFLIEFVSLLEEESLLSFNLGNLQWEWDTNVIDERTMSTANVVDLVHARMKKLPSSTQLVLQYAACLGQRIKFETLSFLWEKLDLHEADLSSLLAQLVKANFFERVDDTTYRWVHDQVKETALMTGDAAEPSFQFEIGCTLYHSLDEEELEDLLFEVTDLINSASVGKRLEFAKLNLRAAEKAKRISAFNSASNYAAKGIERLPKDSWKHYKGTALPLYTIGVQMELAVGRVEIMEAYSEEVLSKPSCTPLEKAPIYLAQCYELLSVDFNPSGSIELGLKVLRDEFGMKFGGPRLLRPVTAIRALLKTIKNVKKEDGSFFEKLGLMTDPEHLVIMDIVARISYSGYFAKDVFIQVLCTIKLVELTMSHGVGVLGGFPFISLGLLAMVVMKDNAAAAHFTQLGFMLQEKCNSETSKSAAMFVANYLIYPWIRAGLGLAKSSLEIGYTSGLRAGNCEMALWCQVSNHIMIPFQIGRPLDSILSKCAALAAQCEQLKLVLQEIFVRLHWQLILKLMGMPDADSPWGNKNMDGERLPVQKVDMQFKDIHQLVFLGDYETAARVASELGDSYDKTHTNSAQVMSVNFLRGVAFYEMARKTGKRKYRRSAKRVRDKIGGWLKAGNPNVGHFYPLLCAEQAALDRQHAKAIRLYHDAIVLSARTGHIQFAALANERYADFCQNDIGDEDEAVFRIGEATRFYREWGAHYKVEQLRLLYEGDSNKNVPGTLCSVHSIFSA